MILFKKDWEKYPKAIIHYNTKNESFLRLARLYKRMGIKNYYFMLALHDPRLLNVDPHDPNLTEYQKLLISEECKINPWYYFREVALVPPPAGNRKIKLRANRANIAFLWLFFNHITSYLIQPRQTGKSLIVNELDSYLSNVGTYSTNISILTKDEKLRISTSRKIIEIMERIPDYLRFLTKKDIKNSERITVKELKNEITLYVGQKDKKAADNLGRGMTTPIVHIDEFAYVYNIHVTLPVLLAATTAASEEAALANQPYGTTFTTTPGKLFTDEGKLAYEVYNGSLRWSEKFLDLENEDELKELVRKNTRKYEVVLLEFNHRQLGFDDEWLYNRIKKALSEGDDVRSDFLMEWVGGNTNSPLTREETERIRRSEIKEPVYVDNDNEYDYVIRWYVNKTELDMILKDGVVAGLDTSNANGRDDIALVIRSIKDGGVIAASNVNETNLAIYAKFLVDLLEKYPTMVLVPENKSTATAILDNMFLFMLKRGMNPFRRIFNWCVSEPQEVFGFDWKDKFREITQPTLRDESLLVKYKNKFGYVTSGSGKTSRSILYGTVFRGSIDYTSDKVRDTVLINQLTALVVKNGKIDHLSGNHDDMVIAWLLSYWFLTMTKNKSYYGINDSAVLRDVVDLTMMKDMNEEDKEKVKKQEKYKKRITDLLDKLRHEENELLALRLYRKIKMLQEKLDSSIVKSFNIDTMLEDMEIVEKLKKKKLI